jgi:glucokinase
VVSVVPFTSALESASTVPSADSRADAHFPLLVADIGGTNARFGWVAHRDAALSNIEAYRCESYASPQEAACAYVRGLHNATKPASVYIGVATAVTGDVIKLTNSPWVIDRAEIERALSAKTVSIYNDFEAIALGLPHLQASDVRAIDRNSINNRLPMAVIGAGTGLGVAGVVPVQGHADTWQTICGEGGHVTLAATNEYQADILKAARVLHPHVSAERLVSGLGLPLLRRAVATVEGIAARENLSPEDITELGASMKDHLSERTLDVFCALMGIVAGNVALTLGARGGVLIAGGIVPKIADYFAQSSFRAHFEAKGRYEEYLRAIATPIITAPYPGLDGLVRHAKNAARG